MVKSSVSSSSLFWRGKLYETIINCLRRHFKKSHVWSWWSIFDVVFSVVVGNQLKLVAKPPSSSSISLTVGRWLQFPCIVVWLNCQEWLERRFSPNSLSNFEWRNGTGCVEVPGLPGWFVKNPHFLLGALEHEFYDFPFSWNVIIPTDSYFSEGWRKTTNQFWFLTRTGWFVQKMIRVHQFCESPSTPNSILVPLHVASHQWNPHFESRNISILDEDSSHVWGFNKEG